MKFSLFGKTKKKPTLSSPGKWLRAGAAERSGSDRCNALRCGQIGRSNGGVHPTGPDIDPDRTAEARHRLWINRTVLSLSVARMADGIGNSILFVIIPLYVVKLPDHLVPLPRVLLIGILISVFGLANACLQPFMAALSDRIGHHKRIIQAGLLVIALTTLAFIFADCYLDLLTLRIAQGLGLAMEIPPTLALLAAVTRQTERGSAMGFFTAMRMAGLTIGPLLGGFLHDALGFDAAFYAGAIILLLALIVVQLGVENTSAPDQADLQCAPLFDAAVIHPGILSAALATFLMASAFTMMTTLENQFNARLGIGAFGFGIAFSALMVSRLLFQVPLGRLSDRLGRKPLILGGLLLIAPATALLGQASSLAELGLLRFIQGVAAAAIVAPALAYAGDIAQGGNACRRSRQMSLVTIGFGLGIAFGPLMAGFLAIYSFQLPFVIDGALCLIGSAVVSRYMTETVRREMHQT